MGTKNLNYGKISKLGNFIKHRPEIPPALALLLLFVVFSLIRRNFFTALNWGSILAQIAEWGPIVLGVTILMISGEFDISIGSNFAFSALIFGMLLKLESVPDAVAFLAALLAGTVIGFINGILTIKLKIPSFIATLGTMMFWRGIVLTISGISYVKYSDDTPIYNLFNKTFFLTYRISIFWLIGITFIIYYLLFKSSYGNSVFAVGGNKDASRAMGINIDRVKLINFSLLGLLVGVGACFSFSRFRVVDAFMGTGLELKIIASVVLGGTALWGGYGNLLGGFAGLTIISMMGSFLVMAGVEAYLFQSVVGVILIIAIFINTKVKGLGLL